MSSPVYIVPLFTSKHPIITTTWFVDCSGCFASVITCFTIRGNQQKCSVVRSGYTSYSKPPPLGLPPELCFLDTYPLPNSTNHSSILCTLKRVKGVRVDISMLVILVLTPPPLLICNNIRFPSSNFIVSFSFLHLPILFTLIPTSHLQFSNNCP